MGGMKEKVVKCRGQESDEAAGGREGIVTTY